MGQGGSLWYGAQQMQTPNKGNNTTYIVWANSVNSSIQHQHYPSLHSSTMKVTPWPPYSREPCPAHSGDNGAPRNKCLGRRRRQTCRGRCLSHGNHRGCSLLGKQAFRRAELYCLVTKTAQVLTCNPFQSKHAKHLEQELAAHLQRVVIGSIRSDHSSDSCWLFFPGQ